MNARTFIYYEASTDGSAAGQRKPRGPYGGRSARVQAAVFAATLALLQESGYEATSVAEIAKRAGVNETSIYRRWKTREALLAEALLQRTEVVIPIPDTGTLRSDVWLLLQGVRAFYQSPLGAAITQLLVSTAHASEMAAARQAFWNQRFALAHSIFERAMQRGELPASTNPELLTEMVIGPLYLRLLVTLQPLDDALLQGIADVIARHAKPLTNPKKHL